MRHLRLITSVLALACAVSLLTGCRLKTVSVRTGEIVLCTQGELVSDTTTQLDVPADEVGEHVVTTRVITCDLHTKLADLYARAQDAIAAGDRDEAASLLAQIVAQDPTYGKAGTQLQAIKSGNKPVADSPAPADTDTGTPPKPDTPGDDTPTGPIVTLASYVPDTLPGFVGQGLIADPFVLTRDYLPATPGTVSKLVIVVEQFKDSAAAEQQLKATVPSGYPDAGAAPSIRGRTGYFGANRNVAAVAYVDGALMVVVEGVAVDGNGTSLKATLAAVAAATVP